MLEFLTKYPWIVAVAAAWTIPWKGVALWKAANARSKVWFIIFLLVNTLGILEIIYIFVFSSLWDKNKPKENYLSGNGNGSRINMGL